MSDHPDIFSLFIMLTDTALCLCLKQDSHMRCLSV